jgi:hypothetical protein
MIGFNGDVIFLDGSGQVRASNGSLTLRADDTGTKDIVVGSGQSLRPEKDVAMNLGDWFLRWHRLWVGKIFAPSGEIGPVTFNSNVLQMSGTISITNATISTNNNSWAILNDTIVVSASADVLFGKRPRITAQNPGPGGGPSQQSVAATLADLVDSRPASGNILVDTDIAYRLADFNKRWATIYGASGIFNILAPNSSGTFMLAGGSIVPELNITKDAIYSLGTSSRRWGSIFATSGVLNTVAPSSSGTFVLVGGSLVPEINLTKDAIYALGASTQRWGATFTASGVHNTLAPFSSGTFVLAGGSLVPELNITKDAIYTLGTSSQRWGTVFATSGIHNTLAAPSSGTFMLVGASLVPERNAIYSLGTSALKWANIFATSGSITNLGTTTFSAANANVDNLSVNVLFEMIDGSTIQQDGNMTWEANSSKLNFNNLLQLNMAGAPILSAGDSDFTSVSTAQLIATSTTTPSTFAKRPTVNGSGVALAEENYFEVYAGRSVNFGATVANDVLEPDTGGAAVANADDHFITNRSVRLVNFSANTQHLNGSQPADWTIRMRLNGSTTDWASGTIKFAPTTSTNLTVLRPWLGNQFIPSGSRCQVSIDNNGGATVNIVFCKAWVGLAVSGTP